MNCFDEIQSSLRTWTGSEKAVGEGQLLSVVIAAVLGQIRATIDLERNPSEHLQLVRKARKS